MSHKINQLKKKKERERAVRKKVLARRTKQRFVSKEISKLEVEEKEAKKIMGNQSADLEKVLRGLATHHVVVDERI